METHDAATVVTVLDAAAKAGATPCLWGDPGIGKSALVEALAAARDVPCETVLGSLCDPPEIGGWPIPDEASGELWKAPPGWARRLRDAGEGVLFLDELTTVPQSVQAAMLGVVFGRRVGELTLPAGVSIVAAANPPDRASDGQPLPAPMANRLLHIDYAPTVQSWIEGMVTGFAPPAAVRALEPDPARQAASRGLVTGFVRARGELLHQFPTGKDAAYAVGRPWPSRRTWQLCADVLAVIPAEAPTARQVAASGLVGDGAAGEFRAWCEDTDPLPEPADVVADPASVAWAELDPSRTYAVIAGVVAYAQGLGTIDGWRSGWAPLGAAADGGRGDVATWGARRLLRSRPPNAAVPKVARRFDAVLAEVRRTRKEAAA